MLDLQAFYQGAALLLDGWVLLAVIGGVAWGVLFAAVPGLSGTTAMAVLLPFTFSMSPLHALVLLIATFSGSMWGGAIPAVLINTPGSPAAIFTALDGYPMTRKGRASEALGISLASSVLGGAIGALLLLLLIVPLARFTLRFGPAEMFVVALFGLTVVAALAGRDFFKGMLAGVFGMLIGLIGLSPTGEERATFGLIELYDGVPLMPVLIGLIALPELTELMLRPRSDTASGDRPSLPRILKGCATVLRHPRLVLQSSVLGVSIGALPGAGGTIASIIAYNEGRRTSRAPETFGEGAPEGVIAAESANNAQEGGSLATMLALGLPGSSGTAVLLGALIMQGWAPGPRLVIDNAPIVYGALLSAFLNLFALYLLGLAACGIGARLARAPVSNLVPAVFILTCLGAYMVRGAVFDVYLLILFGAIGWLMRRHGYQPAAVVLGIILGPMADVQLVRIYQSFPEGIWIIFQRPISLALLAALALVLVLSARRRRQAGRGEGAAR